MKLKVLLVFSIVILYSCNSSILDDPSTFITYALPQKSHVTLTVENSYNTVISTLVDEVQEAGVYTVTFDASHLAEGVYFYTLDIKSTEGDYCRKETKKILLVKS